MGRAGAVGLVAAGAAGVAVLVRRGIAVLHSFESHAEYWRERAEVPGELLYVALGDSTAQAVGATDPGAGYVGRIAEDLAAEHAASVRVVNLSVTGARLRDAVRDQLPLLAELQAGGAVPALVTVTVGANDTGRTALPDFRRDLAELLDALPAGALVAEVPHFRGPRGADAAAFSGTIGELVGRRDDLVLVPLLAQTKGMRPREYAPDWFHPNEVGYDRYYRAFAAARRTQD